MKKRATSGTNLPSWPYQKWSTPSKIWLSGLRSKVSSSAFNPSASTIRSRSPATIKDGQLAVLERAARDVTQPGGHQRHSVGFLLKFLVPEDDAGTEGVAHQPGLAASVGPGLDHVQGAQGFLVFGLSLAVLALAVADAAEVEAQGDETLLGQAQGQGHDNIVVHRAAMQRVRMANDHSGPRPAGGVGLGDNSLEAESGGLERNGALSHSIHPALRLAYLESY